MASTVTSLLLVLVVACVPGYTKDMPNLVAKMIQEHRDGNTIVRAHKDRGNIGACDGSKVSGWWEPQGLTPGKPVTVSATVTAKSDFHSGMAKVDVYLPEGQSPIITQNLKVTCEMIKKVLPVTCPIQAGKTITSQQTVAVPNPFLPPGDYKIMAKVTGDKGSEIMCIKVAKITILDTDYGAYDDYNNYPDNY